MNERVYYFVKSYDEDLPKPPAESFGQILMKNARKSPYFNAGMDRAKLT
ncbi:hypothetical protein [Lactobacillus amylovorus]